MPLHRAAGYPGVTAALHRDAEMRSQRVFWCLPTSSRKTCRAAAPLSLCPPDPRSSPAAAGTCVALPSALPAVPELCAGPDCSWGFVPAQHMGVSASSSWSQPHSRDREEQGGSSCYF